MHVLCWTLSWFHFPAAHSIPSFLLLRIYWLCSVVVAAVGLLIVVGLRGKGGLSFFIPALSSFFWFCLARVFFPICPAHLHIQGSACRLVVDDGHLRCAGTARVWLAYCFSLLVVRNTDRYTHADTQT